MISETSYNSATLEALREKARVIRVKALKEIACANPVTLEVPSPAPTSSPPSSSSR